MVGTNAKYPSGAAAAATLSTRSASRSANALRARDENVRKDAAIHPSERSVAFSPTVRIMIIPSHTDMTDEMKANTWTTSEDSDANYAEVAETVRAARAGRLGLPISDEKICTRGLELFLTPAAALRLQTRRLALIDAVLDAQDKEWQEGNLHANPELLRSISARHSVKDVHTAIMYGATDEAYVRSLRRLDTTVTNKSK